MKLRKFLWSVCKFLLRLIGKLLLLCVWACSELLAVVFTALAKWLRQVITNNRSTP